MRFEHLVEINDPTVRGATLLSREQVWRGLVLRAERPDLFVPSLSEATVVARTVSGLSRALRFGEVTIRDQVRFQLLESVRYEIPAQGEIPRSSLQMTIEEPRPGALFVRFVYDDERSSDDAMLDDLRRAAYETADIETIVTIRWWLESTEADAPRRSAN